MPKWEDRNVQREVFAVYLLQFKRFSWSRRLLENEGPNRIKKLYKLKPWASKVTLFQMFMNLSNYFKNAFSFGKTAGRNHQQINLWRLLAAWRLGISEYAGAPGLYLYRLYIYICLHEMMFIFDRKSFWRNLET